LVNVFAPCIKRPTILVLTGEFKKKEKKGGRWTRPATNEYSIHTRQIAVKYQCSVLNEMKISNTTQVEHLHSILLSRINLPCRAGLCSLFRIRLCCIRAIRTTWSISPRPCPGPPGFEIVMRLASCSVQRGHLQFVITAGILSVDGLLNRHSRSEFGFLS